mgnify:CR=1 FL=1
MTERLSLVAVIERFADGLELYDPFFTRTLAAALHGQREELSLSSIEELQLTDVVVTFRMDREMQLVITGNLRGGPGEITLRYHERDFPEIEVLLRAAPEFGPYVFATLDHGWRGRAGRLQSTGEVVEIRSLTTIGAEISWHVRGASGSEHVDLDDLTLLEE